jgi:uncharacterized DUF497 family protein
MRYTWDEDKRRSNLESHGIDFTDAERIFDGPTLETEDARFDYGEIRVYAIGAVFGIVITVIYTDRDDDERHIISAWKSTSYEQTAYYREIYGR